jgi:hypothetical protein
MVRKNKPVEQKKKEQWPPWKIGVVTVLILIVLMIISANQIWPDIKKGGLYYFQEEPLVKGDLQLKAGEVYSYNYATSDQNATISYSLRQMSGCLLVSMPEIKNVPAPCIYPDGTDASRSNVSFANPMVFFFKPWMLAVKPGWNWTVITKSNLSQNVEIDRFSFFYVNETNYQGRTAYLVEGSMNGQVAVKYYVDREKRVLLREEGDVYYIELVTAPFPLGQQAE